MILEAHASVADGLYDPPHNVGVSYYGRRAVAAVLGTYCVIFLCTIVFGWERTWSVLAVRPMPVPFGDLRAITGATLTIDRGLDPMIDNVGDPWHRPANYPRIWMATAHALRLTPERTVPYGLVLFACFMASLVALGPLVTTPGDAVVMYLGALSPAALLAVERGKIDFVPLALVSGATIVRRSWVRVALLTAATLLKLFPLFALAAFTLARRRARRTGLAALAVIGAWAFVARSDLRLIQSTLPIDSRGGYGLSSLEKGIWHVIGGDGRLPWVLAACLSLGTAFAGWWLGRAVGSNDQTADQMPDTRVVGLILAASIYIGSFFVGSNYDYRLVFLLTALPFFSALLQADTALVSWTALIAIATILVAMCESPLTLAFGHAGTGINDLAKIAVIGFLTWALALRTTTICE